MTKKSISQELSQQLDKVIEVKTLVVQDLIWPEYSECRLFTSDGVYSAIFHDEERLTDFVLAPQEVK